MREVHVAEISKLKEDHTAELFKLKENHVAKLWSLQEEHDLALFDERTIDFNEALFEYAVEIGVIKGQVFKGGYEFGL